jgi:hypothetical protein
MASNKKSLASRSRGAQATTPARDRTHPPTPSLAQASARAATTTDPIRVSRGYNLRADLVKACKRIALEEERPLYEVMEEALEAYLAHKSSGTR